MYLGRVVGTVVASVKYEGLQGSRLLLVQPLDDQEVAAGPLPEDFDFQKMTSQGFTKVQGETVPVLEFRAGENGFARVYVLRPGQFSMKDATETQNSTVTLRLISSRVWSPRPTPTCSTAGSTPPSTPPHSTRPAPP